MSVTVSFACGGCYATAGPFLYTHQYNPPRNGMVKSWLPPIATLAPEGWVAFDPYTNCTYCKECWKGIENAD